MPLLIVLLLCVAPLVGQMVDPSIDAPGQPFSFPVAPTDSIAVRDATAGTEITPEGYLYTGYGELMFLVGHPPVPAAQRIRVLEGGYLPVMRWDYRDGDVRYRISAFAAALRSASTAQAPVNFIRVVATNEGPAARASYFSAALRYTGEVAANGVGVHRFRRPVTPTTRGGQLQAGVEFDPTWEYSFEGDAAVRSGNVMYLFPPDPQPTLWLARGALYSQPAKTRALPTTPVLMAQYKLVLAAGESRTLVFKMPVQPIATSEQGRLNELRAASYDDYESATIAWWKRELSRGMQIELAEKKVTDTFLANLAYVMMARDKRDEDYVQTVNKFHYHAFWLRDGAYLTRAYDVLGYHDLARQCLEYFFYFQQPDGNFVSQKGQFDGWGQAMWAFGQHYQLTRDRDFAQRALPAVRKAIAWLKAARSTDKFGLMPPTNPGDAEFTRVVAYIPGYSLWALTGFKAAIELAKGAGSAEDEKTFRQEHDAYEAQFFKVLEPVTAKTNGYIPPGLDQPGGQDWGNMNLLYPAQNLAPFDPKVTATIAATRAKYAEGLMTYAGRLHHYLTMKNTENFIVRGEQQKVLEELYAILVHTTATHAGFEWGVKPWGDRDFGHNLTPHGWFGAKYLSVIRNMLLREEKDSLHLLSVVSPAWAGAGQRIAVRNAPTHFGTVAYEAVYRANGMTLALSPKFDQSPGRVIVHVPFFVKASGATADGKPAAIRDGRIEVPAGTRNVEIAWTPAGGAAGFSYAEAVEQYKREYARRYQQFLRDGSPPERPRLTQ